MLAKGFELDYVKKQLEVGNYKTLPNTIAIGDVYKVSYYGDLGSDGYEMGFLFIPKGSGIRKHVHTEDIEQYVLVSGVLSVKGTRMDTNECFIGMEHNIDVVLEDTVISTLKISKKYIENLDRRVNDITLFDEVRGNVASKKVQILEKRK